MLLHILTSDAIVARADFERQAERILAALGPRGAFHLRARHLTGRAELGLLRRLLPASRAARCPLIVNERVDLALAAPASGVQLGRGALSVADVRRIVPELQVGASVHHKEDVEMILTQGGATQTMPDWLIAGAVFETPSHPGKSGCGLEKLRTMVEMTAIPVIAVGGITPSRVGPTLAMGAAGVAVISGVWDAPEPSRAVADYLS